MDDGPDDVIAGDNTKGPKPTAARPAAKVRFAVDVEAHAEPTVEPTKQDQRAPIFLGGKTCCAFDCTPNVVDTAIDDKK